MLRSDRLDENLTRETTTPPRALRRADAAGCGTGFRKAPLAHERGDERALPTRRVALAEAWDPVRKKAGGATLKPRRPDGSIPAETHRQNP
ncbi:MAG: hypothetical protein HS102_17100 [Planctomycetia bacterium]|nr:MAG: hypothetical protein EDS66_15295 [Planctomycetota bacterium]MBE7458307.1 hypothetical protein [Planctomycetia bacterium]MCQ3921838.1 hypothetical protein [Planctomycetota bacterium]